MLSKTFSRFVMGGCAAVFVAATPSVHAEVSNVNFAGFASFVYAKTLEKDEGDISMLTEEITNEGEYRDFNKLGLRMDANLHENVAFAVQMLADGANDYDPEFDWIYARFKIIPGLSLDVGKTRVPLYFYSDYIDVSYAYQWILPPDSVYGRAVFSTLDGGKINYTTTLGDWNSEVQIFSGKTEREFFATGMNLMFEVEDGNGIAWTMDRDWLTLRVIYADLDLTLNGFTAVDDLLAGLAPIEAGINAAAPLMGLPLLDLAMLEDDLRMDGDKNRYYGFAASVKLDRFFATTEITHSVFDENMATGDKDAYYLMTGVNLPSNWSVSITYSVADQPVNDRIIDEVEEMIRPYAGSPLEGTAGILLTSVEGAITQAQELKTTQYILGGRWNFHPSASMKVEYIRQKNEAYLFDPLTLTLSETEREPSAYRIGLDLVF